MSEAPQQKAPIQLSAPNRLLLAEHAFVHHAVTAELGTTLEDVLRPEYFAHFASRFAPYHEITVRVDDGTWYAKLVVLAVGRSWVKTEVLHAVSLSSKDVEQTQADSYEVLYRGPTLKFGVVRKADRSVLKDRFSTKAEAVAWAAENA